MVVGWNSSSPPFAIPMSVMTQDAGFTGGDLHPSGLDVRDQAKYPRTVKIALNA